MNSFQIFGDTFHLLSFITLLYKLVIYNSATGISAKTQILFCLIFTTRYLDLFSNPVNDVYHIGFKLFYLCFSYGITISIYTKYRKTYQKHLDTFLYEILIFIALVVACAIHYKFTLLEVAWAFSEYLECMATWPQFFMIAKTKTVTKLLFMYLLFLGCYRWLYIINWLFRYTFNGYYDLISICPGSIQVIPFIIFYILCILKVITITSDKSYIGMNLKNVDQNGIFVIDVNEKSKHKEEHLSLLKDQTGNLEEHSEQEKPAFISQHDQKS